MESRKRHQPRPPVTAPVRIGDYALEVGAPAGSFADSDAASETANARALSEALEAVPSTPVAAAEGFNESAAGVTKRVEQAEDLFRAAAEGRLHDLDSVNGEIDLLLAALRRLDGAGRFEEELRLLRALHGLLALSLRWLDLVRALRRGLAASDAAGDRAAEAWVNHELGALHLAAGDPETAAARFRETLRLKEQLGDVTGRCATRHNLDCAERDLARSSVPPARPGRARRQTALMAAVPLAALVLGVAAGRYQPGTDNEAVDDDTQQTTTVSQPRPPEAVDDGAVTDEDEELSIPVADLLANDDDPNGDELELVDVERIAGRTHGRVALFGGEVVYTPRRNYNGPARFRYRISDGEDRQAVGRVTVEVAPVNDDPQARPDELPLDGESPTVDVLVNDLDVDGDDLFVFDASNGAHGVVSCSSDGECTYTSDSLESGQDSFTYIVDDRNGGRATGRVTVIAGPLPELSIGDVGPVPEPGVASFTVTLSAPSGSTVEVSWEIEAPDAGDFGETAGTVTFAPGDTVETITVTVVDDETEEAAETFDVRLLDAVNATLADDAGAGAILSSDASVE